jgi:hypothetical protein
MMRLLAILCVVVISAASAVAQGGQQPEQRQGRQGRQGQLPPRAGDVIDPGVTPAEIQRMFDAYALVQAQDQLQLNDEQYSRFLLRYKSLQDVRRRSLQEHTRLVGDLRRLLMQGQQDEAQLKDRMQQLQDVDSRAFAEVKKAYEGIDQVLDVRQQAGFRVFEEQMERRKLELITRARQGNRPRQQK